MTTSETQPDGFVELTQPYKHELFVHCYRMLGSLHEAEDLVQETYLRAWRGFGDFEGRSSLRTWLYTIATRACLNALASKSRRVLPVGLGPANQEPHDNLRPALAEDVWLQPLPDSILRAAVDPAEIAVVRSRTRLAMIAALHSLSARERAAVILRDVLQWRAAEVAEALDTSAASVNSSLLRARARIKAAEPREDEMVEPDSADSRAVLDRYVTAFQDADIDSLVSMLVEDVVIEMPPLPSWFAGVESVGRFFASRCLYAHQWRMIPTIANGQPAVAAYMRDADGVYAAHSIQVLTLTRTGIARIMAFRSPLHFAYFDLPGHLTQEDC